jgi:hypothetical protein
MNRSPDSGRVRSLAGLLGLVLLAMLGLAVLAIRNRLVAEACPWIVVAMPRVKLAEDGLNLTGVDTIRNTGRAPANKLQWSYYMLLVPPNDPEKDVYRRMERSDETATALPMASLPQKGSRQITFDTAKIGSGSYLPGPAPDFLQVDRYIRLMFTYQDPQGGLHHTYRCYQVAQRPNRLLSIWSCPLEDVTD